MQTPLFQAFIPEHLFCCVQKGKHVRASSRVFSGSMIDVPRVFDCPMHVTLQTVV